MIRVQGVPGAGIVGITRPVFLQDVIRCVFQPAIAQRRALMVCLRRVVEHDIEDDLDPGSMQRLDHIAKLVDGAQAILVRAVRHMRSEERHGRVPPVVDMAGDSIVGVELEHRQQLHRCHAELLKIRDLVDQTSIRASRFGRQTGARMAGEPTDVHFVDHGLRKRPVQRNIALPVIAARIGDHALHRGRAVVARERSIDAAVAVWHDHSLPVRIQQNFARVESQSPLRFERPTSAIAVELPRLNIGHEDMPVVVCPVAPRVERNHHAGPCIVGAIEEQQLDARAAFRKHAEVDALGTDAGAERVRAAGLGHELHQQAEVYRKS